MISAGSTGSCLGADRPLLHQGVRGRHQRQLRGTARRVEVDGLRQPRHHQARIRPDPRRLSDLSSCIASATAWGWSPFDDDVVNSCPSSAKHMDSILHYRSRTWRRHGRDGWRRRCASWPSTFARRGLLVIVSDLYEEPDRRSSRRCAPLRFRGHDMIVFHLLDPAEIEFGYDDASAFQDLESGEQIPVVPEALPARSTSALVREHLVKRCSSTSRLAHRLRGAQYGDADRSRAAIATCRAAPE